MPSGYILQYKCSTDLFFGQDYVTTILDECHYLKGHNTLIKGTPEYYDAINSPVAVVSSVPQLPDVDPSMMSDVDAVVTVTTPLLHHPPTDVLTSNVAWFVLGIIVIFIVIALIGVATSKGLSDGNYDENRYASYESYSGSLDVPYTYVAPYWTNDGRFVRGHYKHEKGWRRR